MQELIRQGLMALSADDTRAALDNFIDARAVAERARIRVDAADPDVYSLFEGLAFCYMQNNRFELATEPMERAYTSPLRGHSALVNRSVLSLVQHSSPMRAIKDIQAYLASHPEPDEVLLNILGACLYVATADNQMSRSDLYKLSTSFFENKVKELEKTRPGQRRWGLNWVSDFDYAAKAENMDWAKGQYDRAAKVRDTAYSEWQAADADWQYKQGQIKLYKVNSAARSNAVSAADYAGRVADDKNSTYQRRLATANEKYKAIPWPEWPTRFPPVRPDAASGRYASAVAVVTPSPTPPRDPVATAITPRIVVRPTEPSTPSTPVTPPPAAPPAPPVVVATPSASERRMVTRQAVAVPVGPDLLITSAALVDAGNSIQLESANGDLFKAEFVRKDPATGLALLRVSGQRLRYLNLADQFAGGEVQCWGYPEVSIFNVAPQGFSGNAAAPKANWSVSLQRHPRLSGAALLDKSGKLVGIVLCERDTPSSQLPAVSAATVRAFLGADFPTSICSNPDPSGVLQLTVSARQTRRRSASFMTPTLHQPRASSGMQRFAS